MTGHTIRDLSRALGAECTTSDCDQPYVVDIVRPLVIPYMWWFIVLPIAWWLGAWLLLPCSVRHRWLCIATPALVEQRLHLMRQTIDVPQIEEASHALDRVKRPENIIDGFEILRALLQLDEVDLYGRQIFQ